MNVAPSPGMNYLGYLELPKKVMAGEDCSYSLHLKQNHRRRHPAPRENFLIEPEEQQVKLTLDLLPSDRDCDLQLDLRGISGTIGEPRVQPQRLGKEELYYVWICRFPTKGHFILVLVPQVLRPDGPHTFQEIKLPVEVQEPLGLNKREHSISKTSMQVAAFISVVAGILATLNSVFHFFGH